MDNAEHKANIIQLTNDILMKIDSLPLHPRNKILYSRYLHAKLFWDLTVADTDKLIFSEFLDERFVKAKSNCIFIFTSLQDVTLRGKIPERFILGVSMPGI